MDRNAVAWIGFGANAGDPLQAWREAVRMLDRPPQSTVAACSPLYRTEPHGPVASQPWFLNGVIGLTTSLEPVDLLRLLQDLERRLGRRRERETRWGPRRIDLDLLLMGERIVRAATLILPHPRLHLRRFVLRPLAEMAPGQRHPVLGKTVDTLLKEVNDPGRVERVA